MATVGIGDEAQLIDACDEGAEEEKIDEGDERMGSLSGRQAKEGVNCPEDGEDADNEQDQDVGWGELIRFQVAINKVRLWVRVSGWLIKFAMARSSTTTYHHANDRDQKDDLHQAIEDEKQTSNHFAWSLAGKCDS